MIPSKADALLGPVTEIDGFLLACLIDASTGMVLAARQDGVGISLTAAAAGAADMAGVLSLMSGELALGDGPGDVMVTFGKDFHVLRPLLPPGLRLQSRNSCSW